MLNLEILKALDDLTELIPDLGLERTLLVASEMLNSPFLENAGKPNLFFSELALAVCGLDIAKKELRLTGLSEKIIYI